jgi:hypothetical protein
MSGIERLGGTPLAGAAGAPARGANGSSGVDDSLSSTTPDVPTGQQFLSIPKTLGWTSALGIGLGVLLLRGTSAGWGLGALGSGAWKGAAVGAGIGAALIGIDRATGGEVHRQQQKIFLDRTAQIGFVLTHPTKPWLLSMGLGVARDARASQESLYGPREPLDGPQDAFRHTYAAALFSLRAMRDHGVSADDAHGLAVDAGAAHEADGQDNNDAFSRRMDTANNLTGTQLVGDGRALPGEDADANGFVTEHALQQRVLVAMAAGTIQLVDRTGSGPSFRASNSGDLPPNSGHQDWSAYQR